MPNKNMTFPVNLLPTRRKKIFKKVKGADMVINLTPKQSIHQRFKRIQIKNKNL
jgi:hypothetical protein